MDLGIVFKICNYTALAGWLLLAVAPRWKGTQYIVHTAAVPLLLAVAYLYFIVTGFGGEGEGGFGSLEGVMALFTQPRAVLAGWIHYLVFDLFIGAWEVRDAQRLRISHWLLLPCLFFTLMLGPVGLLLYFTLRWTLRREFIINEGAPSAS